MSHHDSFVHGAADKRCSAGISRRAAIGLGAAGVVGLAGVVSLFDFFAKWRESEATADNLKGDAPTG